MVDLQQISDELSQISTQINELQKNKKNLLTKFLEAKANDIFKNHPYLASFSWKQYTPYFNDGDPCIFNVYSENVYLSIKHSEGEVELDNSPIRYKGGAKSTFKEIEELRKDYIITEAISQNILEQLSIDIQEFFKYLTEDVSEELYGSDSEVLVTAEKIESTDYCDHD